MNSDFMNEHIKLNRRKVFSHDWQNSRLLIGQLEVNMRLY